MNLSFTDIVSDESLGQTVVGRDTDETHSQTNLRDDRRTPTMRHHHTQFVHTVLCGTTVGTVLATPVDCVLSSRYVDFVM
jgi:hypothetical protein